VAQVLYASRLPGVLARQDYLRGILLRFCDDRYKEMCLLSQPKANAVAGFEEKETGIGVMEIGLKTGNQA
jgi:hypothetical protein